jgi:hypothetical protein
MSAGTLGRSGVQAEPITRHPRRSCCEYSPAQRNRVRGRTGWGGCRQGRRLKQPRPRPGSWSSCGFGCCGGLGAGGFLAGGFVCVAGAAHGHVTGTPGRPVRGGLLSALVGELLKARYTILDEFFTARNDVAHRLDRENVSAGTTKPLRNIRPQQSAAATTLWPPPCSPCFPFCAPSTGPTSTPAPCSTPCLGRSHPPASLSPRPERDHTT